MSIKSMEKDDNQLGYEYFSYFNYKLYDSPVFIQEEKELTKSELNCHSREESFSNNLIQNMNNSNIEDKFIPLNLLDLSPMKDQIPDNEEKSSSIDISLNYINLYYQNLCLIPEIIKRNRMKKRINAKLLVIIMKQMLMSQMIVLYFNILIY